MSRPPILLPQSLETRVSRVKGCFMLLKQCGSTRKQNFERIRVRLLRAVTLTRYAIMSQAWVFMKRTLIFSLVLHAGIVASPVFCQTPISLPTSKLLPDPSPGRVGFVNSFPATIAISPDGKYAALLNDGYGTIKSHGRQSIAVFNLSTSELKDFPDRRLSIDAHQSYFLGLAFSSNGKYLYASVGSVTDLAGSKPHDTGNGIAVYRFNKGTVKPKRFIKILPQALAPGKKVASALSMAPHGTALPYPAGIAVISRQGHDELLVANDLSDNVVLLDLHTGKVLQQFDLSTHDTVPSSFPYTVVATRDGRRAWCSLWNASKVVELDLTSGRIVRWIPLMEPKDPTAPGSHPSAMLLSPDERLLYVTLSNADAVAVVDTSSGSVIQVASTRVAHQDFAGTTPNALAQSADGKRVFVADASLNAIAVFDRETLEKKPANANDSGAALGFIPTDWYPSALAVSQDRLLIAAAKGRGVRANNGPDELGKRKHPYIPTLLYGSLADLNIHSLDKDLPGLTRRVQENNRLLSDPGKIDFRSGANPIKHVIYILKENRTYDQILGDLTFKGESIGNGDPSLTMYGADITPNEHKLALEFGVLDNFYDSGEVSGDGHEWSNAAITSDYNEKTWPIVYRGKERTYDYGGIVADEVPLDLGEPNVNSPGTGFIWDNLASHHLTYRDYGEYVVATWCTPEKQPGASPAEGMPLAFSRPCERDSVMFGSALPSNVGDPHGSNSPYPWRIPLFSTTRPTVAALRDHIDTSFPDFNVEYPDQLRADELLNEFASFVRARQGGQGTELPAFVLLYLPNDHTLGTAKGKPSPSASVADNDLALGRVVDAVSHSPYWGDTAIFVVEDDAQDGADHVDAHRSIALAISKFSPAAADRPFVDSRFYTTVNMMHTMESLLGLPPMNQNDAYAPVMAPLFSGEGMHAPFTADWRNRDNRLIYQTNSPTNPGAKQSAKMNFTRPDAVDTALLNKILWRDRRGDVAMPSPKHTVFPESRSPDKD
jgi:DNA-binding beta-propeller fold protein YncE